MILIIFAIGMIAFWGLSRYIYQRACLRREKQWPDLETIDNCGNQILKEAWLLKWFVMFLYCCSAWIFYLLGSVLFATAVLSFLMKQSQGMEALQMLIGGFVIFMIPQVVGSVAVFLELVAATIRQVWYI